MARNKCRQEVTAAKGKESSWQFTSVVVRIGIEFIFDGRRIRRPAKTRSRKAARDIESAYRIKLAKGEVGLETEASADVRRRAQGISHLV